MLVRESVYYTHDIITLKGRAREFKTVYDILFDNFKNIPGTDSFYVYDIDRLVKVMRINDHKWAGPDAKPYITDGFIPFFQGKKEYKKLEGGKLSWVGASKTFRLAPEGFDAYHISVHWENDFMGWICNY